MESKVKQARVNVSRVNVSELLHDTFLVKAARSKQKQWHGNGRQKVMFFAAVSKQWRPWQENPAATVIHSAEAKVI